MSIKEIYKEGNTHAVLKKSDEPIITTRDIRPSMYDLLKLPIQSDKEYIEYINNNIKALVEFIVGKENG